MGQMKRVSGYKNDLKRMEDLSHIMWKKNEHKHLNEDIEMSRDDLMFLFEFIHTYCKKPKLVEKFDDKVG